MDYVIEKDIRKITERIIKGNDTDWAMDINRFDWCPGVGLYGILNAYKATNENMYLDFLISWADKHLQEAYLQKTVNSTAPLLTIIELYNITKNEVYLKVCKDIANWVISEAPLTREGGLEHTVTEDVEGFSEQIWADTLFMSCLFLIKVGQCFNDSRYIDFATNQVVIHLKLLQDKVEGLCYHGWNCETKNHMSAVFWARANAWIVYSTTLILSMVEKFDFREYVLGSLNKLICALGKVQRNNGMFGTILNDESSYDEISASAGIACGVKMAVQLEYVDKGYIVIYDRFMNNYSKYIDDNGSVLGVSMGTPIMPTPEDYKKIELSSTLYGQSLMTLALCC